MTETQRMIKRIVIILIYLLIFSAVGFLVHYVFLRIPPTCLDGLQNQKETGVDCGGPCSACVEIPQVENARVTEKEMIQAGAAKYDALVKIENPNPLYGVANFEYSFDFLDEGGKIVFQSKGTSFLLPAEQKYLLVFNVPAEPKPATFEFRIKAFNWKKFSGYEEPALPIFEKEFNFTSGGSSFAELRAKFQNRSDYDFRRITTKAVIRNSAGKPLAVNETNSNDVRVNEEREVIFSWPDSFEQDIDVSRIEIEAEANVFDAENFMKKYGSHGQYESYGGEKVY